MNSLYPNKVWNYKNFNMVVELDIAGEFIYDGVHVLNQMDSIDQTSLLFSFLYHVSVGLERLQKIILVLFEDLNLDNYKEFEENLISHSHIDLSGRICKIAKNNMSARENDFLQMLTSFYKSERYHRFNLDSQFSTERVLVENFTTKYLISEKIKRHFITNQLLMTNDVKELFGRVIGSLSQKYYRLVRKGCAKNNTFSYELRNGSKAEKVFYAHFQNNSLQQQKITESVALKELLVFLRNTKCTDDLTTYIDAIEPLDFDPAFLNDYIFEISKGIIPQSLIDEVEHLYEESGYSIERLTQINIIGDPTVLFGWYADSEDEED